MARFKRFTHSLASGYGLLGANMLYTLASVPLALAYLSKAEFGLWSVVMQITGYVALVDFGMSASVARILIDYKDRRADGSYGAMIRTARLVGVAQGLLVFVVGASLALVLGAALRVPAELTRDFAWLMIGQSAMMAFTFATRIFGHLLMAHQRYDICNYIHSILFAANFGIMWVCFANGAGVFSLLWAQLATNVGAPVVACWACARLDLLPARGQWGRPNRAQFAEVFRFGLDIFIYTIGAQLITTSQTILLTRLISLEAAGIWSVCMRAYLLLTQLIYRVFDYTTPALAEMMVRGERDLLCRRFKQIAILSASLSVAGGTLLALCNGPFVQVWTAGKMGWPPVNDLLLAVWLVFCVIMHAHVGLVGATKQFRFLRYIFFLEGLAFVGLTVLLHRLGGVTAMLASSVACTLAFSLPYGLNRTREYFELSWGELIRWHGDALVMLVYLVPVGGLTWWLTKDLSPWLRLAGGGGAFGCWTAWVFLRYGMENSLQSELFERAPAWAKPALARLGFTLAADAG